MKPRAVHRKIDDVMTRCGQLIEGLETSVSSGTREYVLQVAESPEEVTCKRCLRSIECEERNRDEKPVPKWCRKG